MSATISPKVNRRPSGRKRQRAVSTLPPHPSAESHHNALRSIRSFLKGRSSYDVFPVSYRLIVLDNKLEVKKALNALISNGVVSAPLWDAERSCFAGMFTVADIIHLIQYYYDTSSYNDAAADVEHFQLESLREIERALNVPPPPLLSIHPLRPLYEACQYLQKTHARRLPLLDQDQQTGDEVVLSVLTQYRVLKFIAINCREIPHLHLGLKDLGIGTYVSPTASIEHPENPYWPIKTATLNTTVFDVVHMFSKDGISAVPIIDENGVVTNLYETVDVITLVRLGAYQSLDLTISSALSQRSPDFPGVITCTGTDSLASLMLLIKQRRVHRLVVVEGDDRASRTATPGRSESLERSPPIGGMSASAPTSTAPTHTGNPIGPKPLKGRLVGIITLSDVLRYLVGYTEQSILGGGIHSEPWEEDYDVTGESPTTVRGGFGGRRSGSGAGPDALGLSGSASGSTGPSALGTPDMNTPADERPAPM
ncbi:AMP-activated serine/threonine-protein kinase regulatory subunit [Tulasnella sp. UAMH 9824]|nr:AMP-activated serine/threonine-protein kinase regulatory subunit [Tulasnella sp. UAMH 9824]